MLTRDVLNDIAVGNWRTHDDGKRKKESSTLYSKQVVVGDDIDR
jgi:hypothetical protein